MRAKVWSALLAVYIAWGSTYLAIRFAVQTIPPFLMAGTRFLIAGLILYLWRRLAGDALPTMRQVRSAVIVGILLLLGGNGLVSWAEQHVPSGIAALVVASAPLWMVLINAVRPGGVKPDWRIMLGLLIGFGGITLLVAPFQNSGLFKTMDHWGILALLIASLFWSIGSVYSHIADMPASSLLGTAIEMIGGAAGLYLAGTLAGDWRSLDMSAISAHSLEGLGYLIIFGSLIGFASYAWLLRNAPLSLVSTYAYVNPLVAIFVGAWLGAESLTARIILAALIIVGAVVLINTSKRAKIMVEEETETALVGAE
jgi:drug/metabolite transporter (DMT)-like permease